ncbi:MAG: helix-turn-helix transcriptional regulator [Ignavibacteriae bacterium]|nr:helix-turn-helix transcriptional regulator [Ignavibacteriota bacterium]
MSILIKLGNNIRARRKELELSQEELSFRSNLHRTYIGAVERGEKNVSFKNLCKISKALNLSISDLTKGIKS